MATSDTNRVDFMNRVLLDLGERAQPSGTTTTAQRALSAIKSALTSMELDNNWTFLKSIVQATSWNLSGSVATVSDVTKIDMVTVTLSNSTVKLRELDYSQFYRLFPIAALSSVSADTDAAGLAYFHIRNESEVEFNPYPDTIDTQGAVNFYVTQRLTYPPTDTDFFNMPEALLDLLLAKAKSVLSVNLLGDLNNAQAYELEYRDRLYKQQQFYNAVVNSNLNMYGGDRYGSQGW